MKYLLLILVLVGLMPCMAEEVVLLTETPVAEFSLPDGTVLKNAYAWRKTSEGTMIIHDGGTYFLNYTLLPDEWKAVYMGSPDETITSTEPDEADEPEEATVQQAVKRDRYRSEQILARIPDLDSAAREQLLTAKSTTQLDEQVLVLGILQSLLDGKQSEAKRFLLYIEENEYEPEGVDFDLVFRPCDNCGGDGELHKICKTCDSTGKCDRCDGVGTRKSSFDDSRTHCTACRGKGDCPRCKGKGSFKPPCPKCKSSGKLVDHRYCEILRDAIVREVNELATPGRWTALTSSESSHLDRVLDNLPNLSEPARAFYMTEEYRGGMDTNLVVIGFLHSVLKKEYEEAERFKIMFDTLYPEAKVYEKEKYIKECRACESSGKVERDCRQCEGSGLCSRCSGEGELEMEIGSKIHCTACRGTGKCLGCRGLQTLRLRCSACDGKGLVIDRQRSEIKLGLMVDRLNDFYDAR